MNPEMMIIDDDRVYREFITEGLTDAGYGVSGVHDLDEGLSPLKSGKIRVVLLAMNLPGDETLQILRWLKDELPSLHVIILAKHSHMKTAFPIAACFIYRMNAEIGCQVFC